MKIIKLNFNSPLRIGEIGIGLEECSLIIHSDTIFNAIINAYSLMHNEEKTNEFVKEFENVKISSAFPFSDICIFFPKPRVRINTERVRKDTKIYLSEYAKDLKKIEYISKEYFEKIINNEEFSENEIKEMIRNEIKEMIRIKGIYKEYQIPKVYLDRETKSSDFYFISLIKFKENCGLWFSVDCENSVYKEIISCLRLLQEEGIGGKRTWGYGLFEFVEESIDLNLPKSNFYTLLSLFYPGYNERELFNDNSSWDFVLRGGYVKNERKPRIRMIKEGSVFDKMPKGKILNFNKYSIYGKAFSINIKAISINIRGD